MLREASHRACALHVAGVPFTFTVKCDSRLVFSQYANPALRDN
jgi:hypothetical protein